MALAAKNPSAKAGDVRDSAPQLGRSLEEEMATCSHVLAEKIPWTEGPGGLQSTTRGGFMTIRS